LKVEDIRELSFDKSIEEVMTNLTDLQSGSKNNTEEIPFIGQIKRKEIPVYEAFDMGFQE